MIISDKLRAFLLHKTGIYYDILNINSPDMNYLDIEVADKAYFTYWPGDTVMTVIDLTWTSEKRGKMLAGKFLNKYLRNYSESNIREFVEVLKVRFEEAVPKYSVISGEGIREAYHEDNYINSTGSTLAQSCMRYEKCQNFLDLYVHNPEVCSMAVAKQGDKISGRALIWKASLLQEDFEYKTVTFLDRIYSYQPKDIDCIVKNTKFDYWRKDKNSIYLPDGTDIKGISLKVFLNKYEFEKYPYMDTFKYLAFEELSHIMPYKGHKIIESQEGGASNRSPLFEQPIPIGNYYVFSRAYFYPKDLLTVRNGVIYHKDDLRACYICKIESYQNKVRKLGQHNICSAHAFPITIDGRTWKICRDCTVAAVCSDTVCNKCLALYTICQGCNNVVPERRMYTQYDENNISKQLCEPCYTAGLVECFDCGAYRNEEDISRIDGNNICRYCQDENYTTCDSCDERTTYSYWVGDTNLCQRCYDRDCSYCENCDETYLNEDMTEVQGTNICDNCLSDSTNDCTRCDERFFDEDLNTVESSYVCNNCLSLQTSDCDNCGDRFFNESLRERENEGGVGTGEYLCGDC